MKKIHINNDDNYATPPEFYEELNKRFNFDFDFDLAIVDPPYGINASKGTWGSSKEQS